MPKPRNSWPRLECLCSMGESGCEPRWPACPFCRGHCLPEAFMGWFVKHSWAPLCLLGGRVCAEGLSIPGIHWKRSLTCPLLLITLMGRRAWRAASQGAPAPAMSEKPYWLQSDGRLWQWMRIRLAFTRPLTVEGKKKSTGPGACIITGLSAKAPLPAPFLPAVHHPHPTRSGFPECHLV